MSPKPKRFRGGHGKNPISISKESSFPKDIPPAEKATIKRLEKQPIKMVYSPKEARIEKNRVNLAKYRKRKKQIVKDWIEKLRIDADSMIEVQSLEFQGKPIRIQVRARDLWQFKKKVINATFRKLEEKHSSC